MSAEVRGLDGKVIVGEPPSQTPLGVLKTLVVDIEEGHLNPEHIYIIIECPSKTDQSMVACGAHAAATELPKGAASGKH